MAGSSILVILNSLRLERLPDFVASQLPERSLETETARSTLAHDPEEWVPDFQKDHAQTIS
jgi:ParB-like chromosome segregation protein Spo0J